MSREEMWLPEFERGQNKYLVYWILYDWEDNRDIIKNAFNNNLWDALAWTIFEKQISMEEFIEVMEYANKNAEISESNYIIYAFKKI